MKIVSSRKTLSGDYDFLVSGGVVGTFATGVFVPANAVINRFSCKTIKTFTSGGGGASTVAFNQGIGGANLLVALGFGAFTIGTALQGVDFDANPQEVAAPFEVVMTLGADILTAGRIIFEIEFTEYAI